MNFKQLSIFVKVAELGSFARAAQQLYLSASALTQQLNALERELGCILFERTSKGSCLTEEGKKFLPYARQLLATEAEARMVCGSAADKVIRIGSYHEDSAIYLQDPLLKFAAVCPDIAVRFVKCDYRDYFTLLENGEIDICIHPYDDCLKERGLQFLPLSKAQLCVNVNATNALAAKERVTLADLRGKKIIVGCGCQSHCLDELLEYLREHEPEIRVEQIRSDEEAMEKIILRDYIMISVMYFTSPSLSYCYIPLDWGEAIDFGVVAARRPSRPTQQMLNFLKLC